MQSAIIVDKKPTGYGRLEPDFEPQQQTQLISPATSLS